MAVDHHIHTPRGPFGGTVSKDRCREAVHEGGRGVGFHQCGNKAKVFEDVKLDDGTVERMGFCKIHSAEHREAKRKARREKWEAQDRAQRRSVEIRDAKRDIVKKVMAMHKVHETNGYSLQDESELMDLAERLKRLEEE